MELALKAIAVKDDPDRAQLPSQKKREAEEQLEIERSVKVQKVK